MPMYAVRDQVTGRMSIGTCDREAVLRDAYRWREAGRHMEIVVWDGRAWTIDLELTRLALDVELPPFIEPRLDDAYEIAADVAVEPTVRQRLEALGWVYCEIDRHSCFTKDSDGASGCYVELKDEYGDAPTKPCDTIFVSIHDSLDYHIITFTFPLALLLAGRVKVENLGDLPDEEDDGE